MANRSASEIWESGVLLEQIWDNINFVMHKVILGLMVHLRFFWKCNAYIAASFKLRILFQPTILYLFPVAVNTKVTSCNFEV